jgi:hypothetical protein
VLDSLVLDGSLSYNFRGFAPIYVWTYAYVVNGTSFSAPQSLDVVPFNAGFSAKGNTVTLQSAWLQTDTPYEFLLRVGRAVPRRIQGAVYSAPAVLRVTKVDRAALKILVVPPVQVRRARQTAFYAQTQLCQPDVAPGAGDTAGTTLVYKWTQTAGPPIDMSVIQLDRFAVRVPALTLDTYAAYAFEVTVSLLGSNIPPASTSISFDVLPSPPIALIDGAQYRSLPYDAPLLLDASLSFDPVYAQRGTSNLAFFWPFPRILAATPITADCQQQVDDFIFTWVTLAHDEPTLSLPAQSNLLCPDLQYEFTLGVSHADLPDGFENAPSTRTFTVVTADAKPPTPIGDSIVHTIRSDVRLLDTNRYSLAAFPTGVRMRLSAKTEHTITTYENKLGRSASGEIVQVVEALSTTVAVYAGTSVEGGYSLRYRWAETHDYFDARDAANLAAPIDRASLIVNANVLSPFFGGGDGLTKVPVTLCVAVDLVAPDGTVAATAQSFIDVTLNAAPLMGYAIVENTQGIAGTTRLGAACVDVVDVDEPLSFSFAYMRASVAPPVYRTLTARTSQATAALVLPVGDISVVCYAFDAYGARSVASTPSLTVTVAPIPASSPRT